MEQRHHIMHRVRNTYHPRRAWIWSWKPWEWTIFKGSDEYYRHTIVAGFLVWATNECCMCTCMED